MKKNNTLGLKFSNTKNTRGNHYKLYHNQSKYDIRKYFFTNRVVDIWNSLPDYVVEVDNTNIFKQHLSFGRIKRCFLILKQNWREPEVEVMYNCEADIEV